MPTRRATACAVALLAAGSAFGADDGVDNAPVVQTLPEFLDSVSDNALSPDRRQIYRVDGKRRLVRLGSKWIAVLDEQPGARLGSAGTGTPIAGPPGRAFAISRGNDRSITRARLYVQDDSTGRETGGSVVWNFLPSWALNTQVYRLRDKSTNIKRNEAQMGIRFGPRDLWIEGFVRRAQLEDEYASQNWTDRKPAANFAGLRSQWQPLPELTLLAQAQRAIGSDMAPGDERLARSRTEIGADYAPGFTGIFEGTKLYMRHAFQLGLLSSMGTEERTTYKSVIGASVPDGSPDGAVYTEVRRSSLVSDDDALWVLGWRHTLMPAPRWRVSTLLETAVPIDGATAVRSNTVGISVSQSAHPSHSLLVETEAVNTSRANSYYGAVKYTNRFTENSVSAWRLSATESRPKEFTGDVGTKNVKASAGWGWREPVDKRFTTLWRYSFLGRNAMADGNTTPDVADRRAHIVFGQGGYDLTPSADVVLRGSRRWDRDDSYLGGTLRETTLFVLRGSQEFGERWVASAHAAVLNDDGSGRRNGFGAEIGYKLSRKVGIALGFNPRGFVDDELELDDKLKKGITLRLRFAIDPALSRWLDPPMPGRAEKPEAVPLQ